MGDDALRAEDVTLKVSRMRDVGENVFEGMSRERSSASSSESRDRRERRDEGSLRCALVRCGVLGVAVLVGVWVTESEWFLVGDGVGS